MPTVVDALIAVGGLQDEGACWAPTAIWPSIMLTHRGRKVCTQKATSFCFPDVLMVHAMQHVVWPWQSFCFTWITLQSTFQQHFLYSACTCCRICSTPQTPPTQVWASSPDFFLADCAGTLQKEKALRAWLAQRHKLHIQQGSLCAPQVTTTQRNMSAAPGGHLVGARTLWGTPAMTPRR